MTQFCCGCSLSFGTKVILFLNLLTNVTYIIIATFNIIFQVSQEKSRASPKYLYMARPERLETSH